MERAGLFLQPKRKSRERTKSALYGIASTCHCLREWEMASPVLVLLYSSLDKKCQAKRNPRVFIRPAFAVKHYQQSSAKGQETAREIYPSPIPQSQRVQT